MLAGLSGSAAQVLLSTRDAHDEIISEATERAALIERQSRERWHQALREAENAARELLAQARERGQDLLDEAGRQSSAVAADARAECEGMVAASTGRRALLQEEVGCRQDELAELRRGRAALAGTPGDFLTLRDLGGDRLKSVGPG